jgi:hypothetical protein
MLRFSKDDELSWCVVKRSSLFFHDEHLPFLGVDDGNWREKLANQKQRACYDFLEGRRGPIRDEEEIFFKMTSDLSIRFFMSKGVLREKNYVAIF